MIMRNALQRVRLKRVKFMIARKPLTPPSDNVTAGNALTGLLRKAQNRLTNTAFIPAARTGLKL